MPIRRAPIGKSTRCRFQRQARYFVTHWITVYDDEHSNEGGQRWVTIGQARSGQTLVVVHTFEALDATRIELRLISARKADRHELRDYERAPR